MYSTLTAVAAAFWQPQLNPVALYEFINQRGGRRVPWLYWSMAVVLSLGALAAIGALTGQTAVRFFGGGALGALALALGAAGIAVTFTGAVRFWLLYLISPPWLAAYFLCGLAWAMQGFVVLAAGLAYAYLLGVAVSDVGILWVARQCQDPTLIYQSRTRPEAETPLLVWWRQVSFVRWLVAGLGVGGSMLLVFLEGDRITAMLTGMGLIVFSLGCVRLEAVILSALVGKPAIWQDTHHQWHAGYCGRVALWLPPWTLRLSDSPEQASYQIEALLSEGCLGISVQQACGRLDGARLKPVLFWLSLKDSGGQMLRYLALALPVTIRGCAHLFARLAAEASKPAARQRWLTILTDEPSLAAAPCMDEQIGSTLDLARQALWQFQMSSVVDEAEAKLLALIETFNKTDAVWTNRSWPVALLDRIQAHHGQLQRSAI